MDEKYPERAREIMLGEPICLRLKMIYYSTVPWIKCYRHVGDIYAQLKKKARIYHHDKSEIEFLGELIRYTDQDIKDALELNMELINEQHTMSSMLG